MNFGCWIAWFRYQKLEIFTFEYLIRKRKFCRKKDFASQVWWTELKKKTEIRELIADKNWKKLSWVSKKRKTGTRLILQTTPSCFYTLICICFSFLQLGKLGGTVLKQPHFKLMSMVLYPHLQPFPSSAVVSCHFLFWHFSHPCTAQNSPFLHARMAAARGNGFVPPVPAGKEDAEGASSWSNGWNWFPYRDGWDERGLRLVSKFLAWLYKQAVK